MFRHKGKKRTYIHNIRLASILSFIAGLVNVTGVLSVRTLTTNITGHFAFFAEELAGKNFTLKHIEIAKCSLSDSSFHAMQVTLFYVTVVKSSRLLIATVLSFMISVSMELSLQSKIFLAEDWYDL